MTSCARVSFEKYFATLSVIASLPSCCRSSTALQVNCLVTEPMGKIVAGVTGVPAASEAMPYPLASTTLPSCITPTESPTSPFPSKCACTMLSSTPGLAGEADCAREATGDRRSVAIRRP